MHERAEPVIHLGASLIPPFIKLACTLREIWLDEQRDQKAEKPEQESTVRMRRPRSKVS